MSEEEHWLENKTLGNIFVDPRSKSMSSSEERHIDAE